MAREQAGMVTKQFRFTTNLLAGLARTALICTLPRPVAQLFAVMKSGPLLLVNSFVKCNSDLDLPALELLSARSPTMSLLEMTWLALELLLAARTQFLNQKRALGAGHFVGMTVVLDRGMAAGWPAKAVKSTLRRRSAARLGRLEDGPAAVAADLVEDGLRTAPTGASVADLLTSVAAAFQRSSAGSDADMLGLDGGDLPSHPVFPLGGLSLRCLLLAGTAVLSAFVPTAA